MSGQVEPRGNASDHSAFRQLSGGAVAFDVEDFTVGKGEASNLIAASASWAWAWAFRKGRIVWLTVILREQRSA
jgi:hypothetical protein